MCTRQQRAKLAHHPRPHWPPFSTFNAQSNPVFSSTADTDCDASDVLFLLEWPWKVELLSSDNGLRVLWWRPPPRTPPITLHSWLMNFTFGFSPYSAAQWAEHIVTHFLLVAAHCSLDASVLTRAWQQEKHSGSSQSTRWLLCVRLCCAEQLAVNCTSNAIRKGVLLWCVCEECVCVSLLTSNTAINIWGGGA